MPARLKTDQQRGDFSTPGKLETSYKRKTWGIVDVWNVDVDGRGGSAHCLNSWQKVSRNFFLTALNHLSHVKTTDIHTL